MGLRRQKIWWNSDEEYNSQSTPLHSTAVKIPRLLRNLGKNRPKERQGEKERRRERERVLFTKTLKEEPSSKFGVKTESEGLDTGSGCNVCMTRVRFRCGW